MPLALDSLAPTAACGLRRLRTAHVGFCCRINPDSASGLEIGFNGDALDRVAVDAFGPFSIVEILFDQSGNGRNLSATNATGRLRANSNTLTIGKRAAPESIGTFMAFAVNNGVLLSSANATVLWSGACCRTSSNNADSQANPGAWGTNFGSEGVGFRTGGFASELLQYEAAAYIGGGVASTIVERYASLCVAWRHKPGFIEINCNGAGWQTVASGNVDTNATMSLGRASGEIKHGSLITFNTALPDADVDSVMTEEAAYWGGTWGPVSAGGGPVHSPSMSGGFSL